MTRSTPAQVISYFATKPEEMPKMSTTTDKPDYQSIMTFQKKLDANLLVVPSDTCTLGHLAIAMDDAEFEKLNSGNAFVIPTDPGPKATITALRRNSTDEERSIMPFTAAETI